MERFIGFTFHADGAQFYNEDECMVWSISSVFAKPGMCQDVLTYKFPFCIIPEKQMRSKNVSCTVSSKAFYVYFECIEVTIYFWFHLFRASLNQGSEPSF